MKREATVVDDYLREEVSNVNKAVAAMPTTEGGHPVIEPAMKQTESEQLPQQSLPLDQPDQNEPLPMPSAVVETAHAESAGKSA
jgi:hypothetical protein